MGFRVWGLGFIGLIGFREFRVEDRITCYD